METRTGPVRGEAGCAGVLQSPCHIVQRLPVCPAGLRPNNIRRVQVDVAPMRPRLCVLERVVVGQRNLRSVQRPEGNGVAVGEILGVINVFGSAQR